MSVAERARGLLDGVVPFVGHNDVGEPVVNGAAQRACSELIEQALLAERQLAMEEILAEMDLDDWDDSDEWNKGYNDAHKWYAGIIRSKLDAVATPRGGE